MGKSKKHKKRINQSIKKNEQHFYYKYVSENTLKEIMKYNTLRFNAPCNFNDPFDCVFPGIAHTFLPNIRRTIKPFLSQLVKKIPGSKGKSVPENLIGGFCIDLERQIREELEGLRDEWEQLLKKVFVFCATNSPNNLLMWARYADSHKGAVIKIDVGTLGFAQQIKSVLYVHENNLMENLLKDSIADMVRKIIETPENDIDAVPYAHTMLGLLSKYLFIKNAIWEYEHESRIVIVDESEQKTYKDIPLKEHSIVEIICGVNFNNDKLIQGIRTRDPSIVLRKAKKDANTGTLTFSKLDF